MADGKGSSNTYEEYAVQLSQKLALNSLSCSDDKDKKCSESNDKGEVKVEGEVDQVKLEENSIIQKAIRRGLLESTKSIEVLRTNRNSPLFSAKDFKQLNLSPDVLNGVYQMGFNKPSKIQETALPILLSKPPCNLIAQSQSGTGKTAAFVIAMLSSVNLNDHYPQVLCLAPTYELAIQIGVVTSQIGKYIRNLDIRYAVRGEEVPRNTTLTDHIIIGTPGKAINWSVQLRLFDLSKIHTFVLDEADIMISMQGHQDQCLRIQQSLSPSCHMMLFSATYDEEVMRFAERIVPRADTIRLKREEESLDNIKQYYVRCYCMEDKYTALTNIYGSIGIGQAIIFCHTRKTAHWLSERMSKDGHAVAILSGDLTVDQRIMILDRFRCGKEKVLITTNVLARGIDIEQVTIVVNFDVPMDVNRGADCETYLHRIGRTGRFGKAGIAINLIDSDHAMNLCKQIETHFGKPILYLNCEDSDAIERIAHDKADDYGIKFISEELNVDEVESEDDNSNENEKIRRQQFYGNTREQNFTVNIFEEVLDEVKKDQSKSNKSFFELMQDKMTDICDEGKVKKRVMKEGYGDVVAEGSYMKFDYIGYLDDNEDVFDSTLNNPKCYTAVSGQDSLLYGLQLALATMKIAETSQFLIHYDYAFGKNGIPGVVPIESNILFEVHLYSFEDLSTVNDEYFLDREDRFKFKNVIKVAKNLNVIANESFKTDARTAAFKYKKAIDLLEECIMENGDEEQQRDEMLVKLLIDITICYNRVKWPKKACLACNRAYRLIRTRNKWPAKLLYQNAKALLEIGDYERAYDRIQKADENLPNNEEIRNVRRLIETLIQEKDEIAALSNQLNSDEDNIGFKENASEDIVDPQIFSEHFYSEINRICLNLIDDNLKQSEKIDGQFENKQIAVLSKYVQKYNLQFVEENDTFCIKKV